MKSSPLVLNPLPRAGWLLAACAAAALSACGGGASDVSSTPQVSAAVATATTTLSVDAAELPEAVAQSLAQPLFHVAPVLLPAPDDAEVAGAGGLPHTETVAAEFSGVSTRRLTLGRLEGARREAGLSASRAVGADMGLDSNGQATPMATGSVVATYTPAQIRAAYSLPALPATGTALTAAQAAQLGAGQTIYIVDAYHNPNAAAELATFNSKFGLMACTNKAIAATAALPLATATSSACEFSTVYATAAGGMTAIAPAYNSGWSTEISLDVQWAHATAPLARIVLIEAVDASLNSLLGAIKLANAMGPGVVSMSFGAGEGNWTASVDSAFTGANMTYLAATGDSGAAVSWPAVSPNVVAVGGTSLTYSGTGARSETGWNNTGGGTSAYVTKPTYQTAAVTGLASLPRRAVADVAFNADPATGQYVAVQAPGATTTSWLSAGGTSMSTPQWAGLIAIANAMRAQTSRAALGAPHAVLYGQIGAVAGTYASAFADITKGSDGTCSTCSATVGYDQLTGLGTPNVSSLLTALSGAAVTAMPPVVTPAAISGKVGTALSFTVSVAAPNAVTYSLSGAPSGMAISTTGAVTWATPVAGTYAVTVKAVDSKTGLSGTGLYTVTIAPPSPPVVTSATISGKVGTALAFNVTVTAPNAVTYTLSGAPTGLTINSAGAVAWATPVAGTYALTVKALDTKTGLSGAGVYTVVIAAATAPVVPSASVSGKPGTALSFTVGVTSANPVTFTLTGAPTGMSINSAGVVSWASPVVGTYSVTVKALDSKTGLSGSGVYTVSVSAAGPVITAAPINGTAGKAVSGLIAISDPGATSLSISLSGVPMGMTFSLSGLNLTANWASPVVGTYNMTVKVVDQAGLTATTVVPITIK